jgi:hypothetical protein
MISNNFDLTAEGELAQIFKKKYEKETGKKIKEIVLSFSARYQELCVTIVFEEERT